MTKLVDKLHGGEGDKNTPKDVDRKQLEKGILVEMEHTDDPEIAEEIAIDHLSEKLPGDKKYYDELEKMEKAASLEKSKIAFCDMLAFVNALYYIYYNMHWKSSGLNYYSDHLLYERLYEETLESLDGIAERAIGTFDDSNVVGPVKDMARAAQIVANYVDDNDTPDNFPEIALKIERDFLDLIKKSLDIFESENLKTDGIEDLFQSIASVHETHIYLLGQRNRRSANLLGRLAKIAGCLDRIGEYELADEIDFFLTSRQKANAKKI